VYDESQMSWNDDKGLCERKKQTSLLRVDKAKIKLDLSISFAFFSRISGRDSF
jgi:hypothetical protein